MTACPHCGRPYPPYGAGVPTEHREDYCWGDRQLMTVALDLNWAEVGGRRCTVQIVVDVPACADDSFLMAEAAAKDAIRQFLRPDVHMAEWGPMPINAHRTEDG